MVYLVVALFAASVALLVIAVGGAVPGRSRIVAQRLAELERMEGSPFGIPQRRRRQEQRERLEGVLQTLGEKMAARGEKARGDRQLLIHAGFRGPNAVSLFWGARFGLAMVLASIVLVTLPVFGVAMLSIVFIALWAAAIGFIAPAFYVGRKAKLRKKDIQKALADALDLLVVCVEAGLGLNQAMVRVSDEIAHVSENMSDELVLTNLEIRAGTPREDALRNFAERTGVDDIRSLVAILIQTDRFGTSIAQALRVQSDTLRTVRRQRAEEAAAKTTIKLVFPLVLFIFPAMFVVILGPATIQILKALSGF